MRLAIAQDSARAAGVPAERVEVSSIALNGTDTATVDVQVTIVDDDSHTEAQRTDEATRAAAGLAGMSGGGNSSMAHAAAVYSSVASGLSSMVVSKSRVTFNAAAATSPTIPSDAGAAPAGEDDGPCGGSGCGAAVGVPVAFLIVGSVAVGVVAARRYAQKRREEEEAMWDACLLSHPEAEASGTVDAADDPKPVPGPANVPASPKADVAEHHRAMSEAAQRAQHSPRYREFIDAAEEAKLLRELEAADEAARRKRHSLI